MIYTALDLKRKFTHLTLVGQDAFGELEWMGDSESWNKAVCRFCDNMGVRLISNGRDDYDEEPCICNE